MRPDLIWRGALVIAVVVCSLVGAPTVVKGGLVLAGLVLVGERLVRLRRLGALDGLLLVVGGLLVTLILVGLVLGATPIGLRPTTWEIGLSIVAAAGIAVSWAHPRPERAAYGRPSRLSVISTVPWLAASLAIVVVAVTISVRSVAPTETPPVQMSIGDVTGAQVKILVTSSRAVGPLEMRTTTDGNDLSYPLFSVPAGGSVTTTLAVPVKGRYVITLNYPDQAQPLRTLTLDR